MFLVVLRKAPPRRPPPARAPTPATAYVEEPLPPEAPWGPLKQPNSELPTAVDDVLGRKCRRCHGSPTRHAAPFPLYTWSDTRGQHHGQPIYARIGQAVESGFMPNLIPANPPVERLTEAEKQTLLSWVAQGAPSASFVAAAPPAGSGKRNPHPGAPATRVNRRAEPPP
jgi:hypothetical protein